MTVQLSAIKSGDVLYDVRRIQAGNTTMRRWATWRVHIKEVNHEEGWVIASWNSNPYQKFRARGGKFSWRRSPRKSAP